MNIYLTFHWKEILITASFVKCNAEFFITSLWKNISSANVFADTSTRRFSLAIRIPSAIRQRSGATAYHHCASSRISVERAANVHCAVPEKLPRETDSSRAIDSLKLLVTQSPQAPARNNSHCLTHRPLLARSRSSFDRTLATRATSGDTASHLAFAASCSAL